MPCPCRRARGQIEEHRDCRLGAGLFRPSLANLKYAVAYFDLDQWSRSASAVSWGHAASSKEPRLGKEAPATKPTRSEEIRRVTKGYANDLREIITQEAPPQAQLRPQLAELDHVHPTIIVGFNVSGWQFGRNETPWGRLPDRQTSLRRRHASEAARAPLISFSGLQVFSVCEAQR
jgi:hypothetical protein